MPRRVLPYLVMLKCVVCINITYRFWRFGELKLKVGRGQRGAAMANRFPLLAILRRRHSQSLSTTLPLRIRSQLDLTASSEQKWARPRPPVLLCGCPRRKSKKLAD